MSPQSLASFWMKAAKLNIGERMTVDCKSKRRLLCPNTLCSASNSCPICASAHTKLLMTG